MGLLETVLGSVLGGGGSSPIGGVLGQMLGGGGQGGPLGGLMGGGGGSVPGGAMGGGGLGGLLGQLRQSGLGSHVDSWTGSGQNQSVSPQELHSAFGEQQVNSWANQAGMHPNDFLSQLSQHLPNAVDQMTPTGQLPDEGTVSV